MLNKLTIKKEGDMRLFLKSLMIIACLCVSLNPAKADWDEYLTSCGMGMAGGLVGAGLASSSLPEGKTMGATGYAISALLPCLTAMALKGAMEPQARFDAEFDLRRKNDLLTFNKVRLQREKCLMSNKCKAEGNAILREDEMETRKQGGSVTSSTTTTIETDDE